MDLSTLPTDNLYKFLALSGVLVVLFAVYMNAKLRIHLWARYDAIRRNQATSMLNSMAWKPRVIL